MLQELRIEEYAADLQERHAWVKTLLQGATGLTALSTSTDTLPRSPMMYQLHLCHLELIASRYKQLVSCLLNISCCLTLESLTIRDIDLRVPNNMAHGSPVLPSVHLHSLPRLKHVKFVDCLLAYALSLPADCSVFLDVDQSDFVEWPEPWEKLRNYTTVLRFSTYDMRLPPGIHGFSKLNLLEYCMESLVCQDLADLRHIPNVKVVSMDRDNARGHQRAKLQLTRGSWQSLEVYFLGGLSLNIKDVDSFVKDTESFTFSSENTHGSSNLLYQKIQKACSKHGKSCHLSTHTGAVYGEQRMYVTLSTSKYVAENCPVYNDGMGPAFNFDRSLSHVDNFWPCDPFASVRWE